MCMSILMKYIYMIGQFQKVLTIFFYFEYIYIII